MNETHADAKTALSIFGLGYVGAVSTACFASCGYTVIGVDPDESKVAVINAGQSPIVEPHLPELLSEGVKAGRIAATADVTAAVLGSDISLVCVGTPSAPDGSCDLTFLEQVSSQIGTALKEKDGFHVIAFRSTVPPGSTRDLLLPIIERTSGKWCGEHFGVCFHPEFLRESTAVVDFHEPPKTVVGATDERSGDILAALYDGIDENVIRTTIEAAEMVKYVDNTWHALKVSFANEIGKVCKASGVDSHSVMDIFVQDTKLNISSYYMKPGFAWGGSCLPKDVRGINHLAHKLGVETPVLGSIIASNHAQIDHAINLIEQTGGRRIAFLGVTFKADTDDLRESPVLPVIAALLAKGHEVRVYDPNLDLEASIRHHLLHSRHAKDDVGKLMGRLPELARASAEEACEGSDTIVVSHHDPVFRTAAANRLDHQHVVDLIRVFDGDGLHEKILASGMNGYMQKPVKRDLMITVLDHWAGKRHDVKPRILLAEDNPVISRVVKAMLEKAGYDLDTVATGTEAVEAVRALPYDVVLMDVSMPGMNGLEATAAIRSLPGAKADIPIVAMTAHAVPEQSDTYNGICW
jgi:GDP-mannose 6-dehydrogenase